MRCHSCLPCRMAAATRTGQSIMARCRPQTCILLHPGVASAGSRQPPSTSQQPATASAQARKTTKALTPFNVMAKPGTKACPEYNWNGCTSTDAHTKQLYICAFCLSAAICLCAHQKKILLQKTVCGSEKHVSRPTPQEVSRFTSWIV